MSTAPRRLPFTSRQLVLLIGWGIMLWFVAAQICRLGGTLGWFEGQARLLLYAAVVVGTLPIIPMTKRLAGLGDDQLALGLSIVTMAAMLFDGVALAWFPALYGGDDAQTAAAGAVILWGAGVGIALACLFNRAPPQ
jgi:hypothetical protein